jgi:Secretion system C-terminal sorting domain
MMIFYCFMAAQAALIQQLNDGITVSEVYEINQKTVNDLYMQQSIAPYNTQEQTDLLSIAHQCPLVGGNAVFHARTLVASFMDEIYDDSEACLIFGIQLRSTIHQSKFILQMNPNPAKDLVNLEWKTDLKESGRLIMMDAVGRVVSDFEVQLADKWATIMTDKYPNGFYQIVLKDSAGEILANEKLIIIK